MVGIINNQNDVHGHCKQIWY